MPFSIIYRAASQVVYDLGQMRKHTLLQEDEMVRRAIDALMNNLGPVETARFLNLPRARRLNSVLRHRKCATKPSADGRAVGVQDADDTLFEPLWLDHVDI